MAFTIWLVPKTMSVTMSPMTSSCTETFLGSSSSSQDVVDDVAMDVGETFLTAPTNIGEQFVIESQHVQDRGMQQFGLVGTATR